jgi:AAA domain
VNDARQIKELLRARVTELASYLYPNGKRDGAHWCVGSVNGEPGKSFKICLSGDKAGLWGDFADSDKHSRSLLDLWMIAQNVDFKTALHDADQWLGQPLNGHSNGGSIVPTLDDAIMNVERRIKMRATRRDVYHDREGKEHFVVVRFDCTNGKDFRPFHQNSSSWIAKDPPGKLPLFELRKLIARPSERVFVVEGEKCASALATLGLLVTTSAHGAKSAHKSDWQPLAGRDVVILPDNDLEGRAYAQTVAEILFRVSPRTAVRIVEIPELPTKGDCVDWLERRDAQLPEDITKELLEIVNAAAVRTSETLTSINGREPRELETNWLTTIDAATVRSSELASLKLNPREPLLGDWLCEGDYGIIFSPRGVGKTWLGLLIAKAVATGGQLGEWKAPAPAKVLYIDGEMPADLMRDRDKGLGSGEVEFLNHAILFDRTEKVLNITERAVQEAIIQRCIRDSIRLVVLDNLSTLASGIKENDSFEWECLHNWLLHFRRRKIAVILIHHAGRSGEMRGTSKREDAAFWVISLDDAKKHADDKRGARFISRFTKPSRNTQDEVPAFKWHVVTDMVTGEISVACKAAHSLEVLRRWIEDGVTECSQLAEEMRVSKGTISKWATKAMKEGWLEKKSREYVIIETGNKNGNEGNENE